MLVGDVGDDVSFSGFVIRVRLISKAILPEYVCHYMKSAEAVSHLRAGGGGANISNLNQGILSGLSVPVPPLEVQSTLVAGIHRVNDLAASLELSIKRKLADIWISANRSCSEPFSGQLT